MPKISVILPAFNAQDYLKEAIDSILNQTFGDFELLIYNDGSTDTTQTIIDRYQDPRIVAFHSPENKGYVHWLNEGIKQAKGEYIARMDADDISLPNRIQLQWDFMESHPEVGVCGGQVEIIGSGELVKKPLTDNEIRWWFFKGNPIAHPSVMLRKSVIDECSIRYNESLRPAEDFDMWWRLAHVTQLANLDEILLKYRFHAQQESTANVGVQQKHYQESLSQFLNNIGLSHQKEIRNFAAKLFADELAYTSQNLRKITAFFGQLQNKKSIAFFGNESIKSQQEYWTSLFLRRLSSYDPGLLFHLNWKNILDFHQKSGQAVWKFVFKCLVFWKTRTT